MASAQHYETIDIMMTPKLVLDTKMTLGEGPVWNHIDQRFYCVDIHEKKIYSLDPATEAINIYTLPEKIGVAVPATDGKLIVGLQNGMAIFNPEDTSLEYVSHVEKEVADNRFNDGKCDAMGRFWAGTMHEQELISKGGLYSFDGRSVKKHLSHIGVSNGLDWSADNKTFFYIDSLSLEVKAFDFDLETGSLSNQKVVINVDVSQGYPDGMTIDNNGHLWIAHWDGGCIRQWDPGTGEVLQRIDIPAPRVTSCVFGGKNFDTLYVTTARIGLSEKQLKAFPLSGGIFKIIPGVSGRKANLFRPLPPGPI